ncbi:hypothetical protein COCOBI_17-0540 [Coccomyxa sp. Obi]|nr:hypothetical protein COCOBI_17-0540 [Coccomyxa sp. Obi]
MLQLALRFAHQIGNGATVVKSVPYRGIFRVARVDISSTYGHHREHTLMPSTRHAVNFALFPLGLSHGAATIRGTFSYKHPKVHGVEIRPGMTARMEGVDGEISRIHFVDPNTNAPKPPPTTAVFKNLTSNTTQTHVNGSFFACWFADYVLQVDGENVMELAHQKQHTIKAGKPYGYTER